ncbi:MAG: hypothetical protein RSE12_16885 [Fuscovulum sp.]|nr:MAG: hypothetical protein RSE12_16885 [Fuscovulum sp.]
MNPYIIAGTLGAIILSGIIGYWQGASICEGRHAKALAEAQQQAIAASNRAALRELDRLAAQAEADALAQQLEDQAYADSPDGCGLGADRVRRLNRL